MFTSPSGKKAIAEPQFQYILNVLNDKMMDHNSIFSVCYTKRMVAGPVCNTGLVCLRNVSHPISMLSGTAGLMPNKCWLSRVCLGNVLHTIRAPCGTSYIRHVLAEVAKM